MAKLYSYRCAWDLRKYWMFIKVLKFLLISLNFYGLKNIFLSLNEFEFWIDTSIRFAAFNVKKKK